jgi:hypothetical protein
MRGSGLETLTTDRWNSPLKEEGGRNTVPAESPPDTPQGWGIMRWRAGKYVTDNPANPGIT